MSTGLFFKFCVNATMAQDKAKLKLRAVACPPPLGYRIAGNRQAVKGAEGAAKPFTLDRVDGFLLCSLSPASCQRIRPQAGRGSQTHPAVCRSIFS